jgi:CBS domain-containing protein
MLHLKDIMTRDVITVSPDLSVRDAMELLTSHHVSGAPVLAGGKVVGIISATDLLVFVATLASARPQSADPERDTERQDGDGPDDPAAWDERSDPSATYFSELWSDSTDELGERFSEPNGVVLDVLDAHTVSEMMTVDVCSLPSFARVTAAADYMQRAGIHRLLVIDDGHLAGIVSAMDIARAVAQGRITSRTYVFGQPPAFDGRTTSANTRRKIPK